MSANTDVILRFEMGSTSAEFHQRLPALVSVEFDSERAQFDHEDGERRWSLRLIQPRERRLASLRLPVVDVELVFSGYAPAEVDAFMARFHAHFRRGGG